MNNRYLSPVRPKYQRRARIRRLRQQLRDGSITSDQFHDSLKKVEEDHASWMK